MKNDLFSSVQEAKKNLLSKYYWEGHYSQTETDFRHDSSVFCIYRVTINLESMQTAHACS